MQKNIRQKKILKLFVLLGFLIIAFFLKDRLLSEPIENLIIEPGIGYDIKVGGKNEIEYVTAVSAYVLSENEVTSEVYVTAAPNIPESREVRQRRLNKRFIIGFEKVYIVSEDYARYGIRNMLDILIKNPFVNDNGYVVVCSGKAEDVIRQKIQGYPSSSDYIEGLINSGIANNFFSRKYALIDLVKSVDGEGMNSVLPYIELKEGQIEVTGVAVFKSDKMVAKLNMEDTKMLNILREKSSSGIFEIQSDPKKYIGFESNKKRKVSCSMEDDKDKFTINLDFTGDIISNLLYQDIMYDVNVNNKFEEDMASKIQKKCSDFISKMQEEYKIDMLNLGEAAASTYGRHTGTDWNEAVSNSDIEVNVKVKVDKNGRGDY